MPAGYSGTPLARKLGIKPGFRVGTFGAPVGFGKLVAPLPEGAALVRSPRADCEVLVAFAVTPGELRQRVQKALALLPADGAIWIAWPKKSSAIESKLSFDRVQKSGLDAGLVDNKVAAIDDTWSGLRFVVRKNERSQWAARR